MRIQLPVAECGRCMPAIDAGKRRKSEAGFERAAAIDRGPRIRCPGRRPPRPAAGR